MNPLTPAVIATMVGTLVLAVVYFSLYLYDRKRYLAVWSVGWIFYAVRFFFAILLLIFGENKAFLFFTHVATLTSGMLLLYGTYLFLGRPMSRLWLLGAVAGTGWIVVSISIQTSYFLLSLPTFLFLACIYIWTGIVFLRSPLPKGIGKSMTGSAFIVWGLHKGDYPFLRTVSWFAPWGFLIGAVLEFVVAFGVLLVYYQKTRNDLISGEERYRQLVDELRKEKNVLNRITDTSPSGIIQLDSSGNIIFANPMAENILGLKRQEITARSFLSPEWNITDLGGNVLPEKELLFNKVMASRSPVFAVRRAVRRPDGSRTFLSLNASPLFNSHNAFDGMVATVEDITEKILAEKEIEKHRMHLEELVNERTVELNKAREALLNLVEDLNERTSDLETANERLTELDRLKSMFIASMSHELRTPLNSIIGFTGIMLRGMAGEITEEQEKQLTIVRKSADHLLSLITDIIDLSKIEAGAVEPYIEEFNLSLLVDDVVNSLGLSASEKGLQLSRTVPSGCKITSDERRVRQVLVNIIGNAVKFTDRGKVSLTLGEKDGIIKIEVSDTGPGMDKKHLEQLFKPFSKVSADGLGNQEGAGLGLHLSGKIMDLLGGGISVQSESGKGSIFTLTLPKEYRAKQDEKNTPR